MAGRVVEEEKPLFLQALRVKTLPANALFLVAGRGSGCQFLFGGLTWAGFPADMFNLYRARFHPAVDLSSLFVSEGADGDDNEINQCPKAQSPQGEDH
jgi:hypothetical protein